MKVLFFWSLLPLLVSTSELLKAGIDAATEYVAVDSQRAVFDSEEIMKTLKADKPEIAKRMFKQAPKDEEGYKRLLSLVRGLIIKTL